MKIFAFTLFLSFISGFASAQDKQKPIVVSAKRIDHGTHGFYEAKAKIISSKIVTNKHGNRKSVATVVIYGRIEGNLCSDNRIGMNVRTSKRDYNGPVWKESVDLSFYTYKQHYGKQGMKVAATITSGCLAYGRMSPFTSRITFEGWIGKKAQKDVQSGIFNVRLSRSKQDTKGYRFRVTYNAPKNEWKLVDL